MNPVVPEEIAHRYRSLYSRKVRLFQLLYEFTKGQCGACVESGCACTDNICAHVEEQARKRGVSFRHTGHRLRFIGPTGCIVPPFMRETCTIYLCMPAQVRVGFDTGRYERIKRLCEKIEWRMMELEERFPPLKSFAPAN